MSTGTCEHKWHFAKGFEDVKREEKVMVAVYKSTWVCELCGKRKILEYIE